MVIQAMVAFVIAEVIGKVAGKFYLNYVGDHAVISFHLVTIRFSFSICFHFRLCVKKLDGYGLYLHFV